MILNYNIVISPVSQNNKYSFINFGFGFLKKDFAINFIQKLWNQSKFALTFKCVYYISVYLVYVTYMHIYYVYL